MKVGVVGTGYVGLVQGVVLAEFGLDVLCMDVDEIKIENLKKGIPPIYEPGIEDYLKKNADGKRLKFTTSIKKVVEESEVIFIAVGTPEREDGSADLQYVKDVARDIGRYIEGYKVVVNKSTVPIGTGDEVEKVIREAIEKRGVKATFDIVSNPEFLREGKALEDALRPDRIVVGTSNKKSKEIMKKVYNPLFINKTPFIFTNVRTAEMIKYASNAFLAVKISYINELALLSEKVGADIQEIAYGMGMDKRISKEFLNAGPGYGGSCFPKDTKAIVKIGKKYDENLSVIDAAIKANEKQKKKVVEKIIKEMNGVKGKVIGILGLSFKPETDDMREAPSIDIIRGLEKAGATFKSYCPKGMEESKWRLKDIEKKITYCNDSYSTLNGVDGVVAITEWNEFRGMDPKKMRDRMKGDHFFDLRNMFIKNKEVEELFRYSPIGRG